MKHHHSILNISTILNDSHCNIFSSNPSTFCSVSVSVSAPVSAAVLVSGCESEAIRGIPTVRSIVASRTKVEAESRPSSKILYKRRHKVKDNQNICILPILYANISMSVVSRQRQRNGGKGSDVALARTVLANSFSPPFATTFRWLFPL